MLTSTAVGFIQASVVGIDQMARHGAQVDVERHEIALRQQLLEGVIGRPERRGDLGGQRLHVVIEDPHAEAPARRATA